MRTETARADSVRAVRFSERLDEILALQEEILDSLAASRLRMAVFQGEVRSDITDVQRQLVQIQELTGQSQQRLSELRSQLAERAQAISHDSLEPPGAGPGPEQLYSLGRRQMTRGSTRTARAAFYKLLQDYPKHRLAADAQFQIGQTWERLEPDSAIAAYNRVVKQFPDSPRAPAALYKLGLIAEQRGDKEQARIFYQRVTASYPGSDEAKLARDKLATIQP